MKLEKYRGEFVKISLWLWLKKVWLRPAYIVNCQHCGPHPLFSLGAGVNPNYPTANPEMRPHELIDIRTGYGKHVAGYEYIWRARLHWLFLMLTRFSI